MCIEKKGNQNNSLLVSTKPCSYVVANKILMPVIPLVYINKLHVLQELIQF